MAKRLKAMGSAKYQNDGDPRTSGPGFLASEHPDALTVPLRWRTPRRVFVDSMSDLFHERISDEFIASVFAVMDLARRHTFQVLTKRHSRMRSLLNDPCFRMQVHAAKALRSNGGQDRDLSVWPSPNVWLGVSAENQTWADIRIPPLLDTPAAMRFVSCEPLLGPVDLGALTTREGPVDALLGNLDHARQPDGSLTAMNNPRPLPRIDWVIVGGESGRDARPMHPAWARSLRDQCIAAGVAFHFKQWGSWEPTGQVGIGAIDPRERLVGTPDERGFREVIRYRGTKPVGRTLDGRIWDDTPTTMGGERS